MTTDFPNDGMCHETSGFLFSHSCDRFANDKCYTCQKPLCDDHVHVTPEGTMCTTCLKRKAAADRQQDQVNHPYSNWDDRDRYSHNDVYFYSSHYYPGYGTVHSSHRIHDDVPRSAVTPDDVSGGDFSSDHGTHDPMDFTEGDAESLQREGDADFESDSSAS